MMKRNYQSPEVVETQCSVENGIAASATLWYEEKGQGDFDYVITEDEQWG